MMMSNQQSEEEEEEDEVWQPSFSVHTDVDHSQTHLQKVWFSNDSSVQRVGFGITNVQPLNAKMIIENFKDNYLVASGQEVDKLWSF